MNKHRHHYLSFGLMAQGIELLGACLDDGDFEQPGRSSARFALAIRELFVSQNPLYGRYNNPREDPSLYAGLRCAQTHTMRPGKRVAYTHRTESVTERTTHLKQKGQKLILVCEDLYDDFKVACEDIIGRIQRNELTGDKFRHPFLTITKFNQ